MPHSLPYAPVLEGRTLLDELNHRIKNELASAINLVTFKAAWSDNVEVKEALGNVVDLLHQHVAVHSILTTPDGDTLLDAGESADRRSSVASKVAPRPTAPTATLEIATPTMAMAVATGTPMRRRRRRRLTPMAEPMPLPTMAATTSPHTGNTAPDVFWSVMKID